MAHTVTIIDDEHGTASLYVKFLRTEGFEVSHIDQVAAALKHIESVSSPSDVYVIDLMMPPKEAMGLEESGFGLSTGVVLYKRFRARFPEVPVIILTSVSNPDILSLLPTDAHTYQAAKVDTMPSDLAEKLRGILGDE